METVRAHPLLTRLAVVQVLAALPAGATSGLLVVLADRWLDVGATGMSTSTGMVAYQSTLQTLVSAETRGRAFAVYDVLWNGARLVSLALGSVVVEVVHVRLVYVLSAGLLIVAAVVGLATRVEAVTDSTAQPEP